MSVEMVAAVGTVASTAVAGAFAVLVQKIRKDNGHASEAQRSNRRVLDSIDRRTEAMDDKLDGHAEWIAGHGAWHKGRGDDGV